MSKLCQHRKLPYAKARTHTLHTTLAVIFLLIFRIDLHIMQAYNQLWAWLIGVTYAKSIIASPHGKRELVNSMQASLFLGC